MPSTPRPRAGEVWDMRLDPIVGHEHGGIRPCLVVSNDDFNATRHGLCLIVPMTGTFRSIPTHLPIMPPEGGLTKPSFLLCEQVRAASVLRCRRRRGQVDDIMLARTRQVIQRFLEEASSSWTRRSP